jgi:hypothetical protein
MFGQTLIQVKKMVMDGSSSSFLKNFSQFQNQIILIVGSEEFPDQVNEGLFTQEIRRISLCPGSLQ